MDEVVPNKMMAKVVERWMAFFGKDALPLHIRRPNLAFFEHGTITTPEGLSYDAVVLSVVLDTPPQTQVDIGRALYDLACVVHPEAIYCSAVQQKLFRGVDAEREFGRDLLTSRTEAKLPPNTDRG